VFRAQVADQRQRTAAQQALAPGQRLVLPVVRAVVQGGDRGSIDADQHCCQRGAQAAVVAALQQGQQQRVQFARLQRGEQALLAGGHRRDAHRGERLLDARGFGVGAHQHRDVAGLHRPAFDGGGAGAAFG